MSLVKTPQNPQIYCTVTWPLFLIFKLLCFFNTFIYENEMTKMSYIYILYTLHNIYTYYLHIYVSGFWLCSGIFNSFVYYGGLFHAFPSSLFADCLIFITFSHTSAPLSLLSLPINVMFSFLSCVFFSYKSLLLQPVFFF